MKSAAVAFLFILGAVVCAPLVRYFVETGDYAWAFLGIVAVVGAGAIAFYELIR